MADDDMADDITDPADLPDAVLDDDDDESAPAAAVPVASAPAPASSAADGAEIGVTGVTLDRALIYGVLQGGLETYFRVGEFGITSESTEDKKTKALSYKFFEEAEDGAVFAFFRTFLREEKRLPTVEEINAGTGVGINLPEKPYSIKVFAERIVKRSLRNAMSDRFGDLAELVVTDPEGARKAMAQLVRDTAWSLGRITSYTDAGVAKELLTDYLRIKNSSGELMGLSSPWEDVDKHSLGIQPGELTVLLAKRKVGKTWLLLAWFVHIMRTDLKPGECLLLVSMEMPRKQIYRRLAAIDMKLDYENFRGGKLTIDEERRLEAWAEDMQTPDPSRPTIHVATAAEVRDVADICDKVAELNPLAVGVDGMYILGRDRRMGMWERTIQNCSEIKLDLCAGMDIPVLATTQLKGSKDKHSLEADADDAAYAKAIGDWADAMRGLFMSKLFEIDGVRKFSAMESREFRGVDLEIHFKLNSMDFSTIKVIETEEEEKKPEADAAGGGASVIDGTPPGEGDEGEAEEDGEEEETGPVVSIEGDDSPAPAEAPDETPADPPDEPPDEPEVDPSDPPDPEAISF